MTSAVLPTDLTGLAKTGLKVFRGNYVHPKLEEIPTWAGHIPESKFRSGAQAVYIGTSFRDAAGCEYVWLVMDVEAKGFHQNITANLNVGRELLALLFDEGLTDGLVIMLTGWGLRLCWPYIIPAADQSAFLAWVKECTMIDSSIYGRDKFIRTLGYRGHSAQCRIDDVPIDRHIYRLADIDDLWMLSDIDYLTLTAGPPSRVESMSWLSDILPKSFLSEAWRPLLDRYHTLNELRGTLFFGKYSQQMPRNRRPIQEVLEENGVEYNGVQLEDTVFYRLKKDCPACGKTEGSPWVSFTGRLHCFRATCSAGNNEGLPLSVWLPESAEFMDESKSVDATDSETKAVESIRAAITDAVVSGCNVAAHVTPGAGKSTTSLKAVLSERVKGRAVYAVPEKNLGRELINTARAISPDTEVILLEGRTPSNCSRFSKVEQLSIKGYSPAFLVCPACKKKNPECKYFDNMRQALEHGDNLVVTSHAQLLTVDWNKAHFDRMIIDESPLPTFIQVNTAPWGAIQRIACMIDPSVRKIISRLENVILKQLTVLEKNKKNRFTISRLYAGTAPAGSIWDGKQSVWERAKIDNPAKDALLRALSFFERLVDDGSGEQETLAGWQRRLLRYEINLTALKNLWALLAGTNHCYLNFTQDKDSPVTICLAVKVVPEFNGQVIHLDGTMVPDEAKALLGRDFNIVDGRCELQGLKSVWIRQAGGKIKMLNMTDAQLASLLESVFIHVPDRARSILIGTHKQLKSTVKTIAQKILSDRTVDTAHYFSSRGRNEWQKFDCFIALGTPTPPEAGFLDHGFILFPGDAEEQDRWRGTLRNRELVQMVHRIRPIQGDKTIIIVGREWPHELGSPGITMDRRRGDKIGDSAQKEAVDRLMPFIKAFSFVHREVMLMHGLCLERDGSLCREAMEFWAEAFPKIPSTSSLKDGFTYNIYIGKTDLDTGSRRTDNDNWGNTADKSRMIVFKDSGALRKILDHIQVVTGLPELLYSSKTTGGQKTRGLGYISDARRFYEMMHVPFEPTSWSGIEMKG